MHLRDTFSFVSLLLSFLIPLTSARSSPSASPVIKLDYITLQGAHSNSYNLTYYRRIPFGAPTSGPNRFRRPQPPIPIKGDYDTDRPFDECPQRATNGSEDCLYLGLYSRPWDYSKKVLRPVLVTFYGGGFIQGGASFDIPPPAYPVLDVSPANDYVAVYPNYRTNVFGFLAGKKVSESKEMDLNVGLLDQVAALQWVQKYIHHFGGDKSNVTIWGQSAGGGSVVAQSIASGNKGKSLFEKAMASSPFWPRTYRYDDAESEKVYETVVEGVGCKGEDEVKCLKSVDVQRLRDVSLKVQDSHKYTTSTYTWAPVIDDKFLAKPLTEVSRSGALNADMAMDSYNLHEGENFAPPDIGKTEANSSEQAFDGWLKGFLPRFSEDDLGQVKKLYPPNGTAEGIRLKDNFERAGMVYRDLVLACPALWMARRAGRGYLIEYTIPPAEHASDVVYWNEINAVQKSDPLTYQGYVGAMASFIQTGDPNAHKVTNDSIASVPNVGSDYQFMVRTEGLANGAINMLRVRCDFWRKNGPKVPV